MLSQKTPGELFEPVIARLSRPVENPAHVRLKLWLAPVVTGRLLGARGISGPRRFEQHLRGDGIVAWIIAWREPKLFGWATASRIFVDECA